MYKMDDSENPLVQKGNRSRHLCEVALLLFLTLSLCGLFVLDKRMLVVWTVVCLSAAAMFFLLAMKFSRDALEAYRSVQFRITPRRLNTLNAVEVADDVLGCLQEIGERTFTGEKRFFRMVERGLGSERTREVKSVLFKYLRV